MQSEIECVQECNLEVRRKPIQCQLVMYTNCANTKANARTLPTLTNSSISGSLSSSAAESVMIRKETTGVCVCVCVSEFQFTAGLSPGPCGEVGSVP